MPSSVAKERRCKILFGEDISWQGSAQASTGSDVREAPENSPLIVGRLQPIGRSDIRAQTVKVSLEKLSSHTNVPDYVHVTDLLNRLGGIL